VSATVVQLVGGVALLAAGLALVLTGSAHDGAALVIAGAGELGVKGTALAFPSPPSTPAGAVAAAPPAPPPVVPAP
jgi:hypothetical protein